MEMPRCRSISIQSEVAWRLARRALTEPARWIAPPYSNSFSVSVVLPASGWLMMAKVRRRRISRSGRLLSFKVYCRVRGTQPREPESIAAERARLKPRTLDRDNGFNHGGRGRWWEGRGVRL